MVRRLALAACVVVIFAWAIDPIAPQAQSSPPLLHKRKNMEMMRTRIETVGNGEGALAGGVSKRSRSDRVRSRLRQSAPPESAPSPFPTAEDSKPKQQR